MGITLCGAPSAPSVGWVADQLRPRWAMGIGAASGFAGPPWAIYATVQKLHRPRS